MKRSELVHRWNKRAAKEVGGNRSMEKYERKKEQDNSTKERMKTEWDREKKKFTNENSFILIHAIVMDSVISFSSFSVESHRYFSSIPY